MKERWCKKRSTDKVWWLNNIDKVMGEFVFSFDRKKQYNLFRDYPEKLSSEEKRIFNSENPYWVKFFGGE